MFKITTKEIGNRLKQIRLFLSISQNQLKEKVNINQASVSRMENGNGIKIDNFIKVLCFYSQYIYIDCLFQENFQIISLDGKKEIFKSNINSLVRQLITQAIEDYQKELAATLDKIGDDWNASLNEINGRLNAEIEKSTSLISD